MKGNTGWGLTSHCCQLAKKKKLPIWHIFKLSITSTLKWTISPCSTEIEGLVFFSERKISNGKKKTHSNELHSYGSWFSRSATSFYLANELFASTTTNHFISRQIQNFCWIRFWAKNKIYLKKKVSPVYITLYTDKPKLFTSYIFSVARRKFPTLSPPSESLNTSCPLPTYEKTKKKGIL